MAEGEGKSREGGGVIAIPAQMAAQAIVAPTTDTPRQVAIATFQPAKAKADALASFARQFDEGSQRSANGRQMSAAQAAQLKRIKAAGLAELAHQIDVDVIPAAMDVVTKEYRANYTPVEQAAILRFWTSPAGMALTQVSQTAGLRGQPPTIPPAHAQAISSYYTSPVGIKENGRRAGAQALLVSTMSAAMRRAMTKTDAAMSAAAKTIPRAS